MNLSVALRGFERMARELADRAQRGFGMMVPQRRAADDAPWTLGGDAWPGAVPVRATARVRVRR